MISLLLSPNGRIGRNRFWQGMVILTVISILVAAGSSMLGTLVALLGYLLIYPYICVYGKRLHDIGTTAWWVIGVWIASVIVSFIVSMLLTPLFMSAETQALNERAIEILFSGDFQAGMAALEEVARQMLPLSIATMVVTHTIIALVLGLIPTQPHENKHGPVPGQLTQNTFE